MPPPCSLASVGGATRFKHFSFSYILCGAPRSNHISIQATRGQSVHCEAPLEARSIASNFLVLSSTSPHYAQLPPTSHYSTVILTIHRLLLLGGLRLPRLLADDAVADVDVELAVVPDPERLGEQVVDNPLQRIADRSTRCRNEIRGLGCGLPGRWRVRGRASKRRACRPRHR